MVASARPGIYNSKVKVSQSTIDQLRKGNMADNLKRANSAGASAEYKEAARRFYGNRVAGDSAKGTTNPAGKVRGSGNGKKVVPVVAKKVAPVQGPMIGPNKARDTEAIKKAAQRKVGGGGFFKGIDVPHKPNFNGNSPFSGGSSPFKGGKGFSSGSTTAVKKAAKKTKKFLSPHFF